jgi:hypothetical protein
MSSPHRTRLILASSFLLLALGASFAYYVAWVYRPDAFIVAREANLQPIRLLRDLSWHPETVSEERLRLEGLDEIQPAAIDLLNRQHALVKDKARLDSRARGLQARLTASSGALEKRRGARIDLFMGQRLSAAKSG